MGKSSKSTKVGYHYRPAYHVGLCRGPIDAFLEFRAADKTAWSGALTSSGRIHIYAPQLFGGEKDQGGIEGPVDVMFGEADQLPNAYLQSVLGGQVVAWRGLTTLAFCGGRFGAMNPMPQRPAYKIRKILKGWDGDDCWYPEKARVGMTASKSLAIYIALDVSGSMNEMTSNGNTRLQNAKIAINGALDFVRDVVIGTGGTANIIIVAWWSGATSITRLAADADDIADLKDWVDARTTGSGTNFAAAVSLMSGFFASAPSGALKCVFFITDGQPSATGQTPSENAADAAAVVAGFPDVKVYGVNIDLADTSYTVIVDNTPEDGVPVVAGSDPSALTGVIAGSLGGVFGMNGAHCLYYCRTDSEKGREPRANINDASLRAAADKLFAEGFGLCWEFNPANDTPDSFEERICRIIGGSFERSLIDGEWYLDLARGDYDLDDLPIIGDSDILEFREQPTTLDRAVNSISVRYFDPLRKETVITPAVRALGLIRRFGEIHETLDFPEIPSGWLALRVAERELRARVTPTRTFELVTNPRPGAIRRNQYFRLQSPKRRIADMVCIVGEKQNGTLRSGAIRWKVAQHVYNLPDATYIEIEEGVDTSPDQNPKPIVLQRVFEAPYTDVAASLPRAELEALPDDVGYLLGIAADPGQHLDYTMMVQQDGGEYAPVNNGEWCPTATVDEDAGPADTDFTLSDAARLHLVAIGSPVLWEDELCRVDELNTEAGTIKLGRGCGDTVPVAHASGSRLWFFNGFEAVDTTEYTEGESIAVRMLSNTGSQQLPLGAATPMALTFDSRQARPYPPANVTVNGDWPRTDPIEGEITVDWSHRDRVLQADQLVDWYMASVGPEPGTEYFIRAIADATDTLIDELGPFSDGPQTFDLDFSGTVRLQVVSVRDELECWQAPTSVFEYSNFDFEVFTTSGTFEVPLGVDEVDVLIVGGGGGGGRGGAANAGGGGGGAGGVRIVTEIAVTPGDSIAVVVGAGGAGGVNGGTERGSNGGDSSFGSEIALGGGGGGYVAVNATNGGSGGGAGNGGAPNSMPGTGTAGQGNDGGTGVHPSTTGGAGGGGGAGAAGSNGTASVAGAGGGGVQPIGFSLDWFGGGGGAGGSSGTATAGAGGQGGGGAGGFGTVGQAGAANTGGGGGGGGIGNSSGGAGGSGIVIVRWKKV